MSESKPIATFIADQIVSDHNSLELQEIIDRMPESPEEAAEDFCDAFDLGNWFYDAMLLNDIDINEVLIDVAEERRQQEAEASRERADIERDYQTAQGWPA